MTHHDADLHIQEIEKLLCSIEVLDLLHSNHICTVQDLKICTSELSKIPSVIYNSMNYQRAFGSVSIG